MTHLNRPFVIRSLSVITIVLIFIQTIDYINFTVDDVFISMRVAENAAAGHGMVYNIGDNVEGYSDPLWVLMLTVAAKLGVNQSLSPFALMWFAKGMSYIFGLLSLLVLHRLSKKIFRDSELQNLYAILSVLFVVMSAPFMVWSCGGLEMTLVAFLYILGSFYAYTIFDHLIKNEEINPFTYFGFSVSFILASLARPEPILFAAAGFLTMILVIPKKENRKFVVYSIIPYIFTMLVFLWWRWNMYHDLLPNTYYAKTGGNIISYIDGIKYLLGAIGNVCAPLLILIPLAYYKGWKKNYTLIFLTVITLSAFLFTIFSTGDWMPGARFLIPITPILILLAVLGLSTIVETFLKYKNISITSSISFIIVVGCFAFSWNFAGRVTIRAEANTMPSGFVVQPGHMLPFHQQVSEWLKQNAKDSATIATGEAGLIGYLNPQLRLLDLNGLMDRHIASLRKQKKPFDTDYVLDRKPDYFLLYGANRADRKFVNNQLSSDYFSTLSTNRRFLTEYLIVKQFERFDIYQRKK